MTDVRRSGVLPPDHLPETGPRGSQILLGLLQLLSQLGVFPPQRVAFSGKQLVLASQFLEIPSGGLVELLAELPAQGILESCRRLRWRPWSPASRISLATRRRPHLSPSRCTTAWTRGAP